MMPTYDIQHGPTGRTYQVDAPEGTSDEDLLNHVAEQHAQDMTPRLADAGAQPKQQAEMTEWKPGAGAEPIRDQVRNKTDDIQSAIGQFIMQAVPKAVSNLTTNLMSDEKMSEKSGIYSQIKGAITSPMRAYRGELNINSPEGLQEAMNVAMTIQEGGAFAPSIGKGEGVLGTVKPVGGQWLTGVLEDNLSSLKKEVYLSRDTPGAGLTRDTSAAVASNTKNEAINKWVDGPLRNYIVRRMGSPADEIRQLADEGVLHVAPDRLRSGGFKAHDAVSTATTEAGKHWEDLVDSHISTNPASFEKIAGGKRAPPEWLKNLPGETPVHDLNHGRMAQELGFDHITDVLNEKLASGAIRPEQLSKVSVKDAVRMTHQYDLEAKKLAAESAKLSSAEILKLPATKTYADGSRWVELPDSAASPQNMALVNKVGEKSGWCTKDKPSALNYGGKESRLHVLLDKDGMPQVQIQVAQDHRTAYELKIDGDKVLGPPGIVQLKGRFNKAPDEKFLPQVQDFVKSGEWSDVGDYGNTGLVNIGSKHYTAPEITPEIAKNINDEGQLLKLALHKGISPALMEELAGNSSRYVGNNLSQNPSATAEVLNKLVTNFDTGHGTDPSGIFKNVAEHPNVNRETLQRLSQNVNEHVSDAAKAALAKMEPASKDGWKPVKGLQEDLMKKYPLFDLDMNLEDGGKTLQLNSIAFKVGDRGQGNGAAVMNELKDWAKKNGVEKIDLMSAPGVRGFYEKQGFTKGTKTDEYLFRLDHIQPKIEGARAAFAKTKDAPVVPPAQEIEHILTTNKLVHYKFEELPEILRQPGDKGGLNIKPTKELMPEHKVALNSINEAVASLKGTKRLDEFKQFVDQELKIGVADYEPFEAAMSMVTGQGHNLMMLNTGFKDFRWDASPGAYGARKAQEVFKATGSNEKAAAEMYRISTLHELGHMYDAATGGTLTDALMDFGTSSGSFKTVADFQKYLAKHVSMYAAHSPKDATAELFSMILNGEEPPAKFKFMKEIIRGE